MLYCVYYFSAVPNQGMPLAFPVCGSLNSASVGSAKFVCEICCFSAQALLINSMILLLLYLSCSVSSTKLGVLLGCQYHVCKMVT